jgi:hypothetical protein
MVGFFYQKYKKNLNVQIFSGSTMIDDITVDEDIVDPAGKDTLDALSQLSYEPELPKKYFCFEVNEEILEDDITVKFKLHDNNYSNGFMTRTALAKINCIALIPKSFTDNYNPYHTLKKWAKSTGGRVRTWLRRHDGKNSSTHDLIIRINREEQLSCGWWPSNPNNYKIYHGTTLCSTDTWVGGEFKVVVPLIRKFGVIMCDPYSDEKKYGKIKFLRLFDRIFNKYKTINTSR